MPHSHRACVKCPCCCMLHLALNRCTVAHPVPPFRLPGVNGRGSAIPLSRLMRDSVTIGNPSPTGSFGRMRSAAPVPPYTT